MRKQKTIYFLMALTLFLAPTFVCVNASNGAAVNESAVSQQSIKIKGVVEDALGPLVGVSVSEEGTNNGTITDINGKFSLLVTKDPVNIQFSYIGYKTLTLKANTTGPMHVTLEENVTKINEVVVVGYGSQKKVNVTGAVATVKMADVLGDRPVASTSQALQGAIPGVNITKNVGTPGASMKLNIRGTSRIQLSGDTNDGGPLVLVDNVPMDINMIDPNDIESVSVLKDAASSAIYGARAAFGVILITTKRGKKGERAKVSYNNNFSFAQKEKTFEKVTPLEAVTFFKELYPSATNYRGNSYNLNTWEGLIKDYNANPSKYPLGYYVDPADGKRYDLAMNDPYNNMLSNNAFQQTQNVALEGGSDKTTYRVSLGMLSQDGILVTNKDSYKRYNFSSFLHTDINKWVSVETDIKYSSGLKEEPNLVSFKAWPIFRQGILMPAYYPSGNIDVNGTILPIVTPEWTVRNSPVQKNYTENTRLFGRAIFTPIKDMKINTELTYSRQNIGSSTYSEVLHYANADISTTTADQSYNGTSKYAMTKGYTEDIATNIYATYYKQLGDHGITLMTGFNQETNYNENLDGSNTNMSFPDLPSISGGTGTQVASDSYNQYGMYGVFYRVNYNYKSKYLLEVNGRYDVSSKFPAEHRGGFFPSLSAGWNISEESFMNWTKPALDNLKLRASWGAIGNQAISNYAYLQTVGLSNAWASGGKWEQGYSTPNLVSANFTWETVQTTDFGFDLYALNNRFNTTFDWYQRNTNNMLGPSPEVPSVLGGNPPLSNSANLSTEGWELSMTWRDNIGKDWRYSATFNLFDAVTKVTQFNNPNRLLPSQYQFYTGETIGEIWGFVTDRYYTADDFSTIDDVNHIYVLKPGVPMLDNGMRKQVRPGDILYKNINGKPGLQYTGAGTVDDPGDKTIIGNTTPRYNYSFTGSVGWKNFDLSFFLRGVGKRDLPIGVTYGDINYQVSSNNSSFFWPSNNPNNSTQSAALLAPHLNHWTPSTPNAYYPRLGNDQMNTWEGTDPYNRMLQTKYLQNGAFLRLQNVTLSYTLSKTMLKKIGFLSSAKVFVSGENLLLFDHLMQGLDPESTFTDTQMYPFAKQYSFGINVAF